MSFRQARVAHRTTDEQRDILEKLQFKRAQLASFSNQLNSGKKPSPAKPKAKVEKPKRQKKNESDDEFVESDDDFIATSEGEEEDEGDYEEDAPRKRKRPAKKSTTPKKAPIRVRPKTTTLSESSDNDDDGKSENERDGWKGKPRLRNGNDKNVVESEDDKDEAPMPFYRRTKRVVIVESDEEEDADRDEITNARSLRNVMKQTAKSKKNGKLSDSDYEDELVQEEEADDADDYSSDASDDSRKGKPKKETKMQRDCVRFFNDALRDELLGAARMNDKLADVVLSSRPFDTYSELMEALSGHRGGKQVLESYEEYLENRGMLNRILDDCKGDSEKVAADYREYINREIVPTILNQDMTLHTYQKEGLNWLVMMHEKGLNCILGDEMGLGKTIQIIAFVAWLKEQKVQGPHLIIVPSSTIENWMNELRKWCPDLQIITYYGSMDDRRHIRHMVKKKGTVVDVILTTYNMVGSKSDDKKFFKNFKINYVIYDEGHMLKNCASERYRSLMKIRGSRKILLTGTPLQNNLIELISLMYFVMRKVFDKYCDNITQLLAHFKQQAGRAIDSKEQSLYQRDRIEQAKLILSPYILRRMKSKVLCELPPKTDETTLVQMETEQAELYDYQLELFRDGGENNPGGIIRLRQAANHPLLTRKWFDDDQCAKIAKRLIKEREYEQKDPKHIAEDLLCLSDFQIHQLCAKFTSTERFCLSDSLSLESGKCEYLDKKLPELKAKGEKVLIFSQFTQMLDILEVYMHVRKHSFFRLDGSTPVLERQDMITLYNNDPETFVFLLSTRAGGLGINLTSANNIIIHDIDFNPYNDKQAEDRCHRMGQKKPVHVIRLISKGTIEEGISRLAKRKLQLEKEVTTGARGDDDPINQTQGTEGQSEDELANDEVAELLRDVRKAKPTSPKKRRDISDDSLLSNTCIPWSILETDFKAYFNTTACFGVKKNASKFACNQGYISQIILAEFDWTEEDEHLPKCAIIKVTETEKLRTMCEKVFKTSYEEMAKSIRKVHDNELDVYALMRDEWKCDDKLKMPKYYTGRKYGFNGIHAGYLALEYIHGGVMRHVYHNIPIATCEEILKLLAKLGAYGLRDPKMVERFDFSFMHEMFKLMNTPEATKEGLEMLTERFPDLQSDLEFVAMHIDKLLDSAYKQSIIHESCPTKMLTHGDVWTGNMILAQEETGTLHLKNWIDWQITHAGSPVEDMIRFLNSALPGEEKIKVREKLFEVYYKALQRECAGESEIPFTRDMFTEAYEKLMPISTFPSIKPRIQMMEMILAPLLDAEKEDAKNVLMGRLRWHVIESIELMRKWY
ncbi:unnamed protein product, partial [Mesorhabditis spiculigera]